jgi:hypothetical protein
MANNAMKLTEESLAFVDRYDTADVRNQIPWWKALLESTDEQMYVVLTYRFEDMKFIRESVTIMDSENFHRRFVFVEEGKSGFSQVLLRDYVEE